MQSIDTISKASDTINNKVVFQQESFAAQKLQMQDVGHTCFVTY